MPGVRPETYYGDHEGAGSQAALGDMQPVVRATRAIVGAWGCRTFADEAPSCVTLCTHPIGPRSKKINRTKCRLRDAGHGQTRIYVVSRREVRTNLDAMVLVERDDVFVRAQWEGRQVLMCCLGNTLAWDSVGNKAMAKESQRGGGERGGEEM